MGRAKLMKVLNFGSLNIDYVYQVESILIPGETQASRTDRFFAAAKVSAVAVSRPGATASISLRQEVLDR